MTAERLARSIRRVLPLTLALTAAAVGAGNLANQGRSAAPERGADGKPGAAAHDEQQCLQGVWTLESLEVEGRKASSDKIRGVLLVIEGDQYNPGSGQVSVEYTFRLNPARNPKAIDLIPHAGMYQGRILRGVYALKNDRLIVCRGRFPEAERPAGFATHPDSGWVTTVWKRQKP